MNDHEPNLDTRQAGPIVGLSPRTLEKLRVYGGGPRFRKHGRSVRYARRDLLEWSEQQARVSTSDPGTQPSRHGRR